MKILQVTALYPPHIGGIENHVFQLSQNLVSRGHEISVYTSNIPKNEKYQITNGVKVHRFNCLFSPMNNQIIPKALFKLIKDKDFDVIHAHGYLHFTTYIAALSTIINKIPLIITLHGTVGDVQYENWKKYIHLIYDKTFSKWILSHANVVIALTPSQELDLFKFGVKNSQVVPNGISLTELKNDGNYSFRKKYGLTDEIIVLYVGGLIPRKGLDYLIDSIKYCENNFVYVIVGGELEGYNGYKSKLISKIGTENINKVIFTGKVDTSLLKQAYLESDIFVLPSISEGLPTVLLEAMSYKKAVIASNIPGNSDLIMDNYNGILVKPKDSREIANAINYLIQRPDVRMSLGEHACNTIAEKYTWEKITDSIENIYKTCCRNRSVAKIYE